MIRRLVAVGVWALAVTGAVVPPPFVAGARTEPVTFNQDVAPILHRHCTSCHRPGQMAPMSLLTYETARPWARSVLRQVVGRTMPPWGADPAVGRFANDPSLTPGEIATITAWVDQGAPPGTTPPPEPPAYTEGWQIGQPDLVLSIPKSVDIPAAGAGDYQYIEIPTGLTEDRWIQAVEIRPTDRKAVHHALAFVRSPGVTTPPPVARGNGTSCTDDFCGDVERHDARMGPILVGMAVGTNPDTYPQGAAKQLRAGSVITLQVHYTPYGMASRDQIGVGIVFARETPKIHLKMAPFSKQGFTIPPHASSHVVEAELEFRKDASIWSVAPHAHLRNKSWLIEVIDPDGRRQPILSVPKFDFNWQLVYRLAEPLPVRAGSRLHAVGVFDNSANNKNNPDPAAEVRWGNFTNDEMLFASIVYSLTPGAQTSGQR